MKGQSIAVEFVLTIAIAVGITSAALGLFQIYQENVFSSAARTDAEVAKEKILLAAENVEGVKDAEYEIDLPDRLADKSYAVFVEGTRINVTSTNRFYTYKSPTAGLNITGVVDGGDVRLIKNGSQGILRAE